MRLFAILVLLLFRFSVAFSQQEIVDSLFTELEHLEGADRLPILTDLASHFVYSESQNTIKLSNEGIAIANENGLDSIVFFLKQQMGLAYINLGNFEEAEKNLKEKHQYNLRVGDSLEIAESYCDLGLLYSDMSEHVKSYQYHEKGLAIRERLNDYVGMAYSLNNIGVLFWKWGKYDDALPYLIRSADNFRKTGYRDILATVLGNIGVIYEKQENFEQALKYNQEAIEMCKELDMKFRIGALLGNTGNIYFGQGDYNKALELFLEALQIREEVGYKAGVVNACGNAAKVYVLQEKYDEALELLILGDSLGSELKVYDDLIPIKGLLAKVYFARGDFENAYHMLSLQKTLNDSIFSAIKHEQIEEIKTKYDTERKDAENQRLVLENQNQQLILKKNRSILFLILGLATLVILFVYIYYKSKQSKERMKALESEQRLLRSQMNPHFIFNSITAIQNYIFSHSPKEAVQYLSKFAALIRQILDGSRKELITLNEEVKMLNNYFSLQQMRYSNKFDYTIELEKEIDPETTLIPPMLNQPFIENAIEHGLKKIEHQGVIMIHYQIEGKQLIVEIEDNGIGILKGRQKKETDHKSFAVEATRERLIGIHRKANTQFDLEIIDKSKLKSDNQGTIVRFAIPYIEEF